MLHGVSVSPTHVDIVEEALGGIRTWMNNLSECGGLELGRDLFAELGDALALLGVPGLRTDDDSDLDEEEADVPSLAVAALVGMAPVDCATCGNRLSGPVARAGFTFCWRCPGWLREVTTQALEVFEPAVTRLGDPTQYIHEGDVFTAKVRRSHNNNWQDETGAWVGDGTNILFDVEVKVTRSVDSSDEFWTKMIANFDPAEQLVVNGWLYTIGDENSRSNFRGFAGRKHLIRHADGRTTVTTNLWTNGQIPPKHRQALPDTAVFGDPDTVTCQAPLKPLSLLRLPGVDHRHLGWLAQYGLNEPTYPDFVWKVRAPHDTNSFLAGLAGRDILWHVGN